MRIKLIMDRAPRMGWQRRLAARLGAAGHVVMPEEAAGGPPWPAAVDLLLRLEALLYGKPAGPAAAAPVPSVALGTPDLTIDLSGRATAAAGALRVLYDGSPDPAAAVAALLDGRVPRLAIARGAALLDTGLPAVEAPRRLSAGLASVFTRAADLCVRAVARLEHGLAAGPAPVAPAAGHPLTGAAALPFLAGALAGKARSALDRLLRRGSSWRTGIRRLDGPGLLAGGAPPVLGYTWLPDDGRRYYADPFLIEVEGRRWLFVEEFPYATGTGVISVAEIGADGRAATPRPVLETGSHLSYPYVFADASGVWMIPESSAAGTVELYRATDFPWRWRRERVLLDGLSAADATPCHHDGRLWLFAATTEPGGSSWDALSLFHGDLSTGAFSAHPLNPVLVDAGAARPAGRMVVADGVLVRPAQDCRAGYGAGLALCAVDRLDLEGFGQTVRREITPPAAWRAGGLHTVNEAFATEAIDCFSPAPPPGP